MKKKILMVMLAVLLCAGLTACKSQPAATKDEQTKTGDESNNASGYVFETNGLTISVDTKIENYTAKLGEPKGGYYEAKSCAFEGLDKFWYYDGFTLQAYQKNGEDMLYSVTFDDDTVKTKEGVKLGDSKDKVISAYGSSYKQNGTVYGYESGNMTLEITVKDDAVIGIAYVLKTN